MKKLILTSLLASAVLVNVSAQWVSQPNGDQTTPKYVGIGTTTPLNRFSVKGATASMDFGEIGDQGAISFNSSSSAMTLPNFALCGNQNMTVLNVPSATGGIYFNINNSNKMALSSNGDLTISGAITSISNNPKVIFNQVRSDGNNASIFGSDGWGNFSFSKSILMPSGNIYFGGVSASAGTLNPKNCALRGDQTATVLNAPTATGQIYFSVNDVRKLNLSSNGNFGIGNLTPNNPLSVKGTGTGTVEVGQIPGTDGTVGLNGAIGFSTGVALTRTNCALFGNQTATIINGPSANGAIYLKINDINKCSLNNGGFTVETPLIVNNWIVAQDNIMSKKGILILNKAENNWVDFATRNITGTEAKYDLGNINNMAVTGTATVTNLTVTGASTFANTLSSTGLYGTSTTGKNITFGTGANAANVKMTITEAGNVGIGRTTPGAKLDVYNTAAAGHLRLSANDVGNSDQCRVDLDFHIINQDHTIARVASYYSDSNLGGSGGLRFFTRAEGTLAERVRISTRGNVGIGNIAPLNLLSVKGTTGSVDVGQVGTNGAISFGNSAVAITQATSALYGSQTATVLNAPTATGQIKFNVNDVNKMTITKEGKVGIGCIPIATSQYLLEVKGIIHATEVKVEYADKFPDFVFEKDYKLRSLAEVNSYISEQGHLPEIPSAAEVKANGVNMMEMQAKLLQKVEELTLYAIQQQQLAAKQQQEINELKAKLENK